MQVITCQQIRDALKFKLKLVKKDRIWLFDKNFCALNEEEFKKLLDEVKWAKVPFVRELFDCEDFAHVTSAFIKLKAAKKYEKGVAFGEITVRHSLTKQIHTLNFLVTEDLEAHYFEPQAEIFVNGKNYEPFYARI